MDDRSRLIGKQFPSLTFAVERGKIKEFAMAVNDPNPVYYDREKAREQGYRDIIAPPTFGTVIDYWGGMDFMKMCVFLQVNPVMVLHGEQEYEYFGEINPGDEITATTVVSGCQEKKNMYVLTMDTDYVNQRGETVMKCRHTIIERKGVMA